MAASGSSPATDKDAARYEFLRQLGTGGNGSVYLALDHETGERLALKKLLRIDQKSVLRLKREFRALADLDHPNLVKLYDLWHGRDGWFLIMEYVEGVDLNTLLAPKPVENTTASFELAVDTAQDTQLPRPSRPELIAVFRQIVLGVQALHAAGLLHRDLKPSNVIVAGERVVVLDFGLVRDMTDAEQAVTLAGTVTGTPAYMAPEQASAAPLSEAADWYAVGVMLYEALSGRLPIDSPRVLELLHAKQMRDATPLAPDPELPEDLAALCMALLRRNPATRPHGPEISARLAALSAARRSQPAKLPEHGRATQRTSTPKVVLYGRSHEVAQLRAALERSRESGVVVHLHGNSGSGKSALLEHFLAELEERSDVIVLRGRCYEREAMPFKAIDGVIDALVRHLSRMADICVTHDLDWAWPLIAHDWPRYVRSPAYRSAYMALIAHSTRARLLLIRYAKDRSGDPARIVQADLRALANLPGAALRDAPLHRHRARLAYFEGDEARAAELLRQSQACYVALGFSDECERERYALGLLLGGSEGQQLVAAASASLLELGCTDPESDLHAYYPELFRR